MFALIRTEHFPKNCLQSCPAVKTSLRISSSSGPACHLSGLDKSARIGCFPAGVADFTLPCTHCELFFRIDPREPSQRFRYPVIARCMPSWAPSVAGRRSLHEFSPEIWLKRPLRRPTGGHKACCPAFHRFPWPAKNPLPPASDRYFFPGRSDSLVDTIRVHLGSLRDIRKVSRVSFDWVSAPSQSVAPRFSRRPARICGEIREPDRAWWFLAGLLPRETGMSAPPAGWACRCPLKWSTA